MLHFIAVLKIEFDATHTLGKHSTTELYPKPTLFTLGENLRMSSSEIPMGSSPRSVCYGQSWWPLDAETSLILHG